MSNQFLAEIRIFGFNFAPYTWAQCDGQSLPISQYAALYSIIGTNFGGNGQTTFNLPDMRDRTAVGAGQGLGLRSWQVGEMSGEATHTLQILEAPQHTHLATGGGGVAFANQTAAPTGSSYPGRGHLHPAYATSADTTLAAAAIGVTGGNQPHNNIQPVLVANYCIALQGIFPTRG
jgi:microcystin-dependent protein